MNFDPVKLRNKTIKAAFDYWNEKRADRDMPARGDIDPAEIVPLLPHVMLVDVAHDPLDFSFRLVGTEVVHRYGREFTGRRLLDLDLDHVKQQVFEEYSLSVERGQPEYFVDDYMMTDGRVMHFERLLMPLSDDGRQVNMLFGVQIALNGDRHDTGIHRV